MTKKVYYSEVKSVEDSDDLYIEFPSELLNQMGWDIGDDLTWIDNQDGTFSIQKTKTLELDPDRREWEYDDLGNKVYKSDNTKLWKE